MMVDAHQHAFWHDRDDHGLVADMDESGIDVAWLLTWEVPSREYAAGYDAAFSPVHARADGTHAGIPLGDLLLARDHYPERFVLGYCPDPCHPSAPGWLESAHRIHGARVCGEWKYRMLVDDPRCLNLFRKAGELGMPVVVHLDIPYRPDANGAPRYDPAWYGGTVEHLARALAACPDTIFLGHAPGFWREISGDADAAPEPYPTGPVTPGGRLYPLFETHPNLYGDLSAGSALRSLQRDPTHAVAFIEHFADRLLFARDNYGQDLATFLQSLELSDDTRRKLTHENALRLVPLT